jgi:hypothetical protein
MSIYDWKNLMNESQANHRTALIYLYLYNYTLFMLQSPGDWENEIV